MRRSGFLLGLFSVGGQVLLLRELISSLNGDEFFIGTALFGWLLSVALGAFVGGRCRKPGDRLLFILGAVLLPVMIILVRLSPLAFTDIVGEIIPFTKAAVLSILAMCPVGIISGWLFPAIAQKGQTDPTRSIGTVYLFEGIGAFAGGLIITLTAGELISSLGLALILSVVTIASIVAFSNKRYDIPAGIVAALTIIAIIMAIPSLDGHLDSIKYDSYDIAASFDTPYSHQTILKRDESIVLMTDNTVDAVYPDRETIENLVIPPLLYHPEAKRILFVGRAEFGVFDLASSLNLDLTALDPRESLNGLFDRLFPSVSNRQRIDDDPVSYLSGGSAFDRYDIIILDTGEPNNYQKSRYITEKFLSMTGSRLENGGILFISVDYDTDRYLATEKKQILSILYNTLERIFVNVNTWPGSKTLFFASSRRSLDLPYDTLISRINRLNVETQYIHEDYLANRLSLIKTERLLLAVKSGAVANSLKKPILPHYQALYRSLADSVDRKIIGFILRQPLWIILFPALIALFFVAAVLKNRRTNQFALFLYFIAGLVSLSLELVSFYLYQSTAGSLYSELAILIGSFMLGLALGTYYSMRVGGDKPLEFPALILFLAAGLIFIGSYGSVSPDAALPYYAFFLFVAALATGTLFIGATNRYYAGSRIANRGTGYGWELVGSSLGALLTTTMFLPVIGLSWLLWSLVILIGLTFAGALATAR